MPLCFPENESDMEDELILPSKPKKERKSRATESKKEETDQSSKSDCGSSSENYVSTLLRFNFIIIQ